MSIDVLLIKKRVLRGKLFVPLQCNYLSREYKNNKENLVKKNSHQMVVCERRGKSIEVSDTPCAFHYVVIFRNVNI